MNAKYSVMSRKRAFIHWYVSAGMEEGELAEAQDDVLALEKDYEELNMPTHELENR